MEKKQLSEKKTYNKKRLRIKTISIDTMKLNLRQAKHYICYCALQFVLWHNNEFVHLEVFVF